MRIRRGIIAVVAAIVLATGALPAFGFDTYKIHPKLARHIAAVYRQTHPEFGQKEEDWLALGSFEEDEPAIRVLNHFYDPIRRQGLSIAGIWLGLPSPAWSHASFLQSLHLGAGDCSWPTAVYSYQQGDRAKSFRCLGHTLHLLEDVTVPAHVRNDQHLEGDLFEQWAKYADPEPASIKDISQPNCETDQECIAALALEVNMQYMSADTLDDRRYGSPFSESTVEDDYLVDGSGNRLAAYNPRTNSFNLTTEIHLAYWQRLSPLLTQYGQELLDIFFREVGADKIHKPETLPDALVEIKNKHLEAVRPIIDIADTARVFIDRTVKESLPAITALPLIEHFPLVSTAIPEAPNLSPSLPWILGNGQPAATSDFSSPAPPSGEPAETPETPGHVMIGNFQPSGSLGSRDEWIEFYNPTARAISGADFKLQIADATADPWYDIRPFEFSHMIIPSRGYAYIAGLDASYAEQADAVFHLEFLDDTAGYIRLLDNSDNELDRIFYDTREAEIASSVPRTNFNHSYITSLIRRNLELAWRFNDCPSGMALDEANNTRISPISRLDDGWRGCGFYQNEIARSILRRPISLLAGFTVSFHIRNGSQSRLAVMDENGQQLASLQAILPDDNEWHHVVITASSDNSFMYIDGSVKESLVGNFTISLPASQLTIERGEFDEMLVWSRVLSVEEIGVLIDTEI